MNIELGEVVEWTKENGAYQEVLSGVAYWYCIDCKADLSADQQHDHDCGWVRIVGIEWATEHSTGVRDD